MDFQVDCHQNQSKYFGIDFVVKESFVQYQCLWVFTPPPGGSDEAT